MPVLSKLTVIIPTYNRYKYLLRSMTYWSGMEITVHVLDGSKNPVENDILSNLASNIQYHHLPIPILDRLKIAVNLVNTEYSALIGDDEFLLPSGLLACINTIESEGLVSCLGRSLFFYTEAGKVIAEPLNHESGSPWHPGFRNYKIVNNDPASRVKNHMNPYLSTGCYSVTKTDVWKKNLLALAKSQNTAPSSSEIAFELCSAYQGKSRVINSLMWLRGGELPNQLAGTSYIEFNEWYVDPIYKKEVFEFINNIVDILLPVFGDYTKDQIYSIIKDGCDRMRIFENTRRFGFKGWFVNESSQISFVALRYYIKKMIRRVFEKLKIVEREDDYFDKYDTTLYGRACAWKDAGIGVDLDEIKSVSDIITNFHKQ